MEAGQCGLRGRPVLERAVPACRTQSGNATLQRKSLHSQGLPSVADIRCQKKNVKSFIKKKSTMLIYLQIQIQKVPLTIA